MNKTGILLALVLALAGTFSAQAKDWEMSEDGKTWGYYYSPDDPVLDDWIEVDGTIYYLDAQGRMKTGWVTNKDNGNKYYMGEDGSMSFNTFTPDDHYVGPEGTTITSYDTYRKAVRTELKNVNKKKNKSGPQLQPCFLLVDLNQDGYKDLVITDALENGGSILEIAVWDMEEEVIQLSAEFDVPGSGDKNTLYLDPKGEGIWLEIVRGGSDISLFQMKSESGMLEGMWEFQMELDDWGGPLYCVNGLAEERDDWDNYMKQAMEERGNTPLTGFVPATEENISEQLDRVLDEQEVKMW